MTEIDKDEWAKHTAKLEQFKATLRKLDGWAASVQEISVYGPPGCINVVATSRTREARDRMLRALQDVKRRTKVFGKITTLDTTIEAKANHGTCLRPTMVKAYRVYAYPPRG